MVISIICVDEDERKRKSVCVSIGERSGIRLTSLE